MTNARSNQGTSDQCAIHEEPSDPPTSPALGLDMLKQLYEEADLASAPGSDCPLRVLEVRGEAKRLDAWLREVYEED